MIKKLILLDDKTGVNFKRNFTNNYKCLCEQIQDYRRFLIFKDYDNRDLHSAIKKCQKNNYSITEIRDCLERIFKQIVSIDITLKFATLVMSQKNFLKDLENIHNKNSYLYLEQILDILDTIYNKNIYNIVDDGELEEVGMDEIVCEDIQSKVVKYKNTESNNITYFYCEQVYKPWDEDDPIHEMWVKINL